MRNVFVAALIAGFALSARAEEKAGTIGAISTPPTTLRILPVAPPTGGRSLARSRSRSPR